MFIPFLVYVRHFLNHTIVFLAPLWPGTLGSRLVRLMVAPTIRVVTEYTRSAQHRVCVPSDTLYV